MKTLKQVKATESTLKAHTMNKKREKSCLGKKRKVENKEVDKYEQMRSSRQNDKLEQWTLQRAVNNEVLGSIFSSKK